MPVGRTAEAGRVTFRAPATDGSPQLRSDVIRGWVTSCLFPPAQHPAKEGLEMPHLQGLCDGR
jgi:hypothetical protein